MIQLSSYIESPNQQIDFEPYTFHTIIVDLPFCSVRAHRPYDWSIDELHQLLSLRPLFLALNLDGIYSDQELAIIESTIHDRSLDCVFTAFRIQDPGLSIWIKDRFPNMTIQCNPETGVQNLPAMSCLFKSGISLVSLNHEIPYADIQLIQTEYPTNACELFVQGPILIQYSRRRFLSDLYQSDPETPLRFLAQDAECPTRNFTFLNTNFGHFMFAQFHRSLATSHKKLGRLTSFSWLIDARGESDAYRSISFHLYASLASLNDDQINDAQDKLTDCSNKPQKPGFFLSNNTDYDWRDYATPPDSRPIGMVVSARKNDAILLEFFQPMSTSASVVCHNPDNTHGTFSTNQLLTLDLSTPSSIQPFIDYVLAPPVKGIQVKGMLYLKNS